MKNMKLQAMIEAAIMAAMAMILDFLPALPLDVSFSMVPVFVVAFRWGWKTGFLSGFLWGVLQIILGDASILTPLQGFIEYFIAFAFIGFSGFFMRVVQDQLASGLKRKAAVLVILAVFIGSFARYFCHFIAGIYFWDQYAPEGMSAVWYSFIVNGSTMIFTFLLCAVITVGLTLTAPYIIMNRSSTARA